ncbi:MTH938/NDUFAF3 family protein [uncultured Methanomethylovorans sp.]|uniref:Mth938-like domain-containing protein n=1 Tax=uncultured Methanomethylovorans sp. TaxID=183759 RepID=UPI002AA8A568|nr:MTH938/NDUFAF3 family protein [uncultured Methanomethylovorans sp.]
MKPNIDATQFGSMVVEGVTFEKDIVIRLDGDVRKRKKKLSKKVYGTSHKISLAEAKNVYDKGAEKLIIGSGQQGVVKLSKKADEYFKKKDCDVELLPTPEAIVKWNEAEGKVIGLFHLTC